MVQPDAASASCVALVQSVAHYAAILVDVAWLLCLKQRLAQGDPDGC
jgi:hypothetical protein